jgi:hypothetical protein
MWHTMLDQGGYTPTPASASIEDQLYSMGVGVEAMCIGMPQDTCDAWRHRYARIQTEWLDEWAQNPPGGTQPYAEWLRQQYDTLF